MKWVGDTVVMTGGKRSLLVIFIKVKVYSFCVYSLEYVFTSTCSGNCLPSLGIVHTNVKLQCTSLKIYS
jgi:hypothetical protein